MSAPEVMERDGEARIAYHRTTGRTPTVVFLPGFASDMGGTKALHLESWCRARGQAFLRFDYQGHGGSSGRFVDGTIGEWAADARGVIRGATEGPLVLVGSSMGGWMMLLAALAMPDRVAGLLGIAAAPDFTEDLLWDRLTDECRDALRRDGIIHVPSDYAEAPCPITLRLVEEARAHLVLRAPIRLACPVRLVHGLDDPDVPWQTALRLADALASDDVQITLVKGAGHRLSEPAALDLITTRLAELLARLDPPRPAPA